MDKLLIDQNKVSLQLNLCPVTRNDSYDGFVAASVNGRTVFSYTWKELPGHTEDKPAIIYKVFNCLYPISEYRIEFSDRIELLKYMYNKIATEIPYMVGLKEADLISDSNIKFPDTVYLTADPTMAITLEKE